MDCVKWRTILLQWVKCTKLIENSNEEHLEQINIKSFYKGFRVKMLNTVNLKDESVEMFLKNQFPDCNIKCDESCTTSHPNLMYIFSIFLYYSCVKHPEHHFQHCCSKLDGKSQTIIANFFRELVEQRSLNKESIRAAIQKAIPLFMPPFMSIGSPVKTPNSKKSPPTPTTLLLNEKKRENKLLQAQLESEHFERGYLEVQLKQSEEKVEKLVKDYKKQVQEIQGLKGELLEKDAENVSPNRTLKEEQTKKRLRKQIAVKDEEIQNLRMAVEAEGDEIKNIKEKLVYSEKHVKELMNRTREQEDEIDQLKNEVEAKSEMINCLLETNMELQTYVSEMRKSNPKNNISIECLDQSFTMSTNTTGSNLSGSPENLGRSVIDLLLKEKENKVRDLEIEIIQIQETLSKMSEKNQLLASENQSLSEKFTAVSLEVKKLLDNVASLEKDKSVLEIANRETVASTTAAIDMLKAKFADLEVVRMELEGEVRTKATENSNLQAVVADYSKNCGEMELQIMVKEALILEHATTIDRQTTVKADLQIALDETALEIVRLKDQLSDAETQSQIELGRLEKENQTLMVQLEVVKEEVKAASHAAEKAAVDISVLTAELADKVEETQTLEAEIRDLQTRLDEQGGLCKLHTESLFALQADHQRVNDELEQLTILNDSQAEMCAQQKEENSNLHLQLASRNTSYSCLQKKYEAIERNLEYSSAEQQRNLTSLTAEKVELEKKLSAVGKQLVDSEERACQYQVDLQEKCVQATEQRQHLANTENAAQDWSNQVDELNLKIESLTAELSIEVTKRGTAEQELTTSVQSAEELQVELSQNTNLIKELQEQVQETTDILNEYMEKVTELEAMNAVLQSSADENIQKVRTQQQLVEELQKNYQDSNKNCEQLALEMNEAKLQITALSQAAVQLETLAADKQQLENDIAQLTARTEKSAKDKAVLNHQVEDLTQSKEQLESEIKQLKGEVTANTNQIAEIDAKNAVLQSAAEENVQKVQQLVEKFNVEKHSLTIELESLQKSCEDSNKNREQLGLEMNEAKLQITALNQEIAQSAETFSADKQQLENEMTEKNVKINDLNLEIVRLTEELESMNAVLKLSADENIQKVQTQQQLVEELQKTNLELNTNREQLVLEMNEAKQQTSALQDEVSKSVAQAGHLSADKQQLENEILQLNAHTEESEKEKAVLNHQVESLTQSKQQLESEINQLAGEVTANTNKTAEIKSKNAVLQSSAQENIQKVQQLVEELNVEKHSLAIELESLQKSCDDSNTNREQLGLEMNEAKLQIIALQKVVSKSAAQAGHLSADKQQLENEMAEKNAKINDLNSEIVRLVEELNVENNKLTIEIASLKESSANSNKNHEQLVLEMSEAKLQICALQEEISTTVAHTEQLSADKQQLENEMAEKNAKINDLNSEIVQLTEKKHSDLEAITAVLQSSAQENIQKVQAQQQLVQESNKNREQLVLEMNEAKQQICAIQEAVSTSVALTEHLSSAKEKLENEVVQLTARNAREKAALVDDLTQSKQQLESEIKQLENKMVQKDGKISALNLEIVQLTEQCEKYREQLSESEAIEAVLQSSADQNLQKVQTQQQLFEESNTIREQLVLEMSEANQQISALQEAVSTSVTLTEHLSAVKQQLENEILQLTARTEESEKKKAVLNHQVENLTQSKQELESEIKQLAGECKRMIGDVTSHTNKIEEIEAETSTLKEELAEKLTAISTYQSDCSQYTQRIEQLIQEKDRMENEICQIEREIVTKNDSVCEQEMSELRQQPLSEKLNVIKQQVHNLNLEKSKFISTITDLDRKLESASSENYKLQDKCAQLQESFVEATQMRSDYEVEVQRLRKMLEDSEANYIMLKTITEKSENIVDRLKMENLAATLLKSDYEALQIEHNRVDAQKKALETTLLELELQDSVQQEKIVRLQAQIDNADRSNTIENSRIVDLSKQLEKLKLDGRHVDELEQLHQQEKEMNERLQSDVSIFQAKLIKQRQLSEKQEKDFAEERKTLQDRVGEVERASVVTQKEIRLEMEGKLEKMKEKMKSLYNDEMHKTKTKLEKEIIDLRTETQGAIFKAQKFEMHAEKLNKQCQLIELRNAELKKENEFVKNKLHFLEENSTMASGFSKKMLPPATTSAAAAPNGAMGSNYRMEDEEGECFNNTYLTDLQTGRMSMTERESMRLSELQYRNSMQLPHLRSTYAPQFLDPDNVSEDVIKNGALNDDSMSSLLPNGTRKKMSGTTSYKRPGPPTPSKNAGRLSFGGVTDNQQQREILRESHDSNLDERVPTNSKKATPSKNRFFGRFANKTDEHRAQNVNVQPLPNQLCDAVTPSISTRKLKVPRTYSTSTPKTKTAKAKKFNRFDTNRRILFAQPAGDGLPKTPEIRTVDLWRESPADRFSTSTDSESSSIFSGQAEATIRRSSTSRRSSIFKTYSTIEGTLPFRKSILRQSRLIASSCAIPDKLNRFRGINFTTDLTSVRRRRCSSSPAEARDLWRKKSKEQRRITFNKYRSTMLYPSDGDATSINGGSLIKKSLFNFSDAAVSPAVNTFGARDSLTIAKYKPPNGDSKNSTQSQEELFEVLLKQRVSEKPFSVHKTLTPTLIDGNPNKSKEKIIYSENMIINRRIPYFERVSNIFQAQQFNRGQRMEADRNSWTLKTYFICVLAVLVLIIILFVHLK